MCVGHGGMGSSWVSVCLFFRIYANVCFYVNTSKAVYEDHFIGWKNIKGYHDIFFTILERTFSFSENGLQRSSMCVDVYWKCI